MITFPGHNRRSTVLVNTCPRWIILRDEYLWHYYFDSMKAILYIVSMAGQFCCRPNIQIGSIYGTYDQLLLEKWSHWLNGRIPMLIAIILLVFWVGEWCGCWFLNYDWKIFFLLHFMNYFLMYSINERHLPKITFNICIAFLCIYQRSYWTAQFMNCFSLATYVSNIVTVWRH